MTTLRIVSPCEHNISHHIVSVPTNSEFWIQECKDARRRPMYHKATEENYPETEDVS